jgi:type IV secretion system protein VirB10
MTDESNDLRSRMAEIEGKGATAPSDKPAEPDAKDEGSLRSRMADIEGKATSSGKRGSAAKSAGLAAAALVLGIGGYAVYNSVSQPSQPAVAIPTSNVQDFPEDRSASDSLGLPDAPDPIFIDRPVVTTQTDSATLARLADLETELAAARALVAERENETEQERVLREELERERDRFASDIATLRSTAENDQERARAIEEQLQASLTGMREQIAANQRDLAAAQTKAQQDLLEQSENFQQQLNEARAVDPLEQERLRAETLRLEEEARERDRQAQLELDNRARLEELRAERAALERERAQSALVAVNNSGASEAGAAEGRQLSANESFVQRVVEPVPVARATQITAPQATVPQGTIIQASLETAVDSTLPGPIRGVVSEDVHSMDGSAVLIPGGSKVFGEYSSGIELGQERILIVWTRILTPSNRSVNIASYGADQLGRSGTGGAVDTRFGKRFGGAAAISIIGAGPAIAANKLEDDDVSTVVQGVGDDFSSATDTAIGSYINLPPTIHVRQGTSVTIIVDRDLEIF